MRSASSYEIFLCKKRKDCRNDKFIAKTKLSVKKMRRAALHVLSVHCQWRSGHRCFFPEATKLFAMVEVDDVDATEEE